jgi:hypothetical protein
MAKRVKIVNFIDDREGREDAERQLENLVNDDWRIITAGGGNGAGLVWGFVILQKEEADDAAS